MNPRPILLICLAAVITGGLLYRSLSSTSNKPRFSSALLEIFARWQQQHGRLYATPAEREFRLGVFTKELEFVARKNKEYEAAMTQRGEKLSGPMFEMNAFGDLTQEEFSATYTGVSPINEDFIQRPAEPSDLDQVSSASPNLGQTGFTPKVRHQGTCGSCWAFSAVVELERKIWNYQKQYVDLSQQELVDCVTGSNGCQGGHPEFAYDYVRSYGIRTAAAYPYMSAKMACRNNIAQGWTFNDLSFQTQFWGFTVARSQQAYNNGVMPPVMVFAEGAFKYLSRTDDVYDASLSGECDRTISHAITQYAAYNGIVIVLNSWGTGWGYGGYKRIKPCRNDMLWGNGGRLVIPYGY